ncbi:hypothetical protein CM15mP37_13110 [bacterium]|nr:MAG: hypothetical protein CM15mP37_13110 [bacterium]
MWKIIIIIQLAIQLLHLLQYKNIKPVAQTQTISLVEDSSVSIQLTGSDSEGYDLSYGRSNVKNGTLTGFLPNVIYTPDSNFFGADSFKFVTNDGFINSDSATISILVNAVNDEPILSLSDMDTLSLTQKQPEAFIFPIQLYQKWHYHINNYKRY